MDKYEIYRVNYADEAELVCLVTSLGAAQEMRNFFYSSDEKLRKEEPTEFYRYVIIKH